jgi:hypothetical protein
MIKRKKKYNFPYFSQNISIFFWKTIDIYIRNIFNPHMKKKFFFYKKYNLHKKSFSKFKKFKYLTAFFNLY